MVDEPIDKTLMETLNKNREILNQLKPIADVAYWIKIFVIFSMLVMILFLSRYFGLI